MASHESSVRAACAHRHAQALAVAHHDVCAPFARGGKQGQRQQICGCNQQGLVRVALRSRFAPVVYGAGAAGVLHQGTKMGLGQRGQKGGVVAGRCHAPAHGLGTGAQHFQRLGVHIRVHHKHVAAGACTAPRQSHGFGGGGGFVQHGGVGHRHGREVADQGLKIEQGFQTALGNFCLIGRVGGVPRGVFQNIALDNAGGVRAVIALANKAFENPVAAGNGFELLQGFLLGCCWRKVHGGLSHDVDGHNCLYQGLA